MFEVAGEFDGNKNQGVRTIIDEIGTGSRKVMESGERPSLEADVFTKNIVKEWTDVNVTEGVMNVNMKEAVMDVNMKEAVEKIVQEDIPSTLEKSIGDVMKNHNEPEDSTVTIVIVVVVGVLIIGILIIAIYLRKRRRPLVKEDVKKGKTEGSRAVKCVSERFKELCKKEEPGVGRKEAEPVFEQRGAEPRVEQGGADRSD
ncbi:uncharacterized protein LOC111717745 [Eurytemora carolleeae]|uniref:uncharacterized protein LOC111717745 n=1 Tax=Eurytemora carolleeae TaxID=1294199 RepID=UPI000C75BBD3|nr:uncharacterized protein LOC111717745 [Eurytemora carolleeae]|eukprot:XP_023348986.1 uncharacterized protein LOC111717745 [Eurytemora affinis]